MLHISRGMGFSYSDSFSFKGRKLPCGLNPTIGLSFRPRDCLWDSPGPSFEGRYLGLFWFGTAGKCMLDFVGVGFRTVHDRF